LLTICAQETKLVALEGQAQVRSKIAIDNNLIEQVYSLKSLGNLISYEKEVDFDINVLR